MNKTEAIDDVTFKNGNIHWSVPHYTPAIPQQGMLSKQSLSKIPGQLLYKKQSGFMKEENNQNLWSLELGGQEDMNIPIWINVGI